MQWQKDKKTKREKSPNSESWKGKGWCNYQSNSWETEKVPRLEVVASWSQAAIITVIVHLARAPPAALDHNQDCTSAVLDRAGDLYHREIVSFEEMTKCTDEKINKNPDQIILQNSLRITTQAAQNNWMPCVREWTRHKKLTRRYEGNSNVELFGSRGWFDIAFLINLQCICALLVACGVFVYLLVCGVFQVLLTRLCAA